MNKLEMIELEPYEAPALDEISALITLRGQEDAGQTNPAGDDTVPGGDTPPSDDDF